MKKVYIKISSKTYCFGIDQTVQGGATGRLGGIVSLTSHKFIVVNRNSETVL